MNDNNLNDRVPFCVVKPGCKGPSVLAGTCYGFTGGDKWVCQECKGYAVLMAQAAPIRPSIDSSSSR